MTDLTHLGLSPREEVVILLADGDTVPIVAGLMGAPATEIRAVGQAYGWPVNRSKIRAVAKRLRAGDREDYAHAGPLPGCPWVRPPAEPEPEDEPTGCPDDCGGCSCHLGNSAPCMHCVDNHDRIDEPEAPAPEAVDTGTPEEIPLPTDESPADRAEGDDSALEQLLRDSLAQVPVYAVRTRVDRARQTAPTADPLAVDQRARLDILGAVLDRAAEATCTEVLTMCHWVASGELSPRPVTP